MSDITAVTKDAPELDAAAAHSAKAGANDVDLQRDEHNEEDDRTADDTEQGELPQDSKEANTEGGKVRTLLSVLRKFVGVKDLASQRFSLPANLLHPQANLDYWCYFDRPDFFAVIPEMEDPLDRMLAVVRYGFSKELKFYDGKIVKPFNSILGEHFRCHWQLAIPVLDPQQGGLVPVEGLRVDKPKSLPLPSLTVPEDRAAVTPAMSRNASRESSPPAKGLARFIGGKRSGTTSAGGAISPARDSAGPSQPALEALLNGTALVSSTSGERTERRIVQLVEQTSHHPPVSCYYVSTDNVEAYGVDQLAARFTGSSVKIGPGAFAKGIFIKLKEGAKGGSVGEEYQATHATASINGLLRGSLWLSVADQSYITCRGGSRPGLRMRAIIEYKEESWVGKAKYALTGIIYEYDPAAFESEGEGSIMERHKKIADVAPENIKVHINGCWKGMITYKLTSAPESEPARTLIDLSELAVLPKQVRPLEEHEPLESRRVWRNVIEAIHAKNFSRATKEKQIVEQRQRDEAAERKKAGTEYYPQFFEKEYQNGRPTLTAKGREVVESMLKAGTSA
ncbi:unnamed protein product [Tilletia controversa]|nr:unnamed protein product [Tilletia controversa]CAD6932906.1 unnamed protein product [Tilletia controversa]